MLVVTTISKFELNVKADSRQGWRVGSERGCSGKPGKAALCWFPARSPPELPCVLPFAPVCAPALLGFRVAIRLSEVGRLLKLFRGGCP